MKYLRTRDVLKLLNISRSTLFRLEKKGLFPKRIKIGDRAIGWIEKEVSEWMKKKAAKK